MQLVTRTWIQCVQVSNYSNSIRSSVKYGLSKNSSRLILNPCASIMTVESVTVLFLSLIMQPRRLWERQLFCSSRYCVILFFASNSCIRSRIAWLTVIICFIKKIYQKAQVKLRQYTSLICLTYYIWRWYIIILSQRFFTVFVQNQNKRRIYLWGKLFE